MKLRSLALRTDVMLLALDAAIEDRGDCLVVRTPDNPDFWWGNCLILPGPPAPGELAAWLVRFGAEIGAGHVAITWDGIDGETGGAAVEAEIAAAGLRIERTLALACDRPIDAPAPAGLAIRALDPADDRDAIERLSAAVYPEDGEFAHRRRVALHGAVAAGRGAWSGCLDGGALVAMAGLFWDGTTGRFQEVQTDPAYRRRGIAGALIAGLAREGLERVGLREVVICADEADPGPQRLYRALGFEPRERVVDVTRRSR